MRTRPHVLYWVKSLMVVQQNGGDAGQAVKRFDMSQQLEDTLKGPKRQAVWNLLEKIPKGWLQAAMDHVDQSGSFEDSGSDCTM